MNITTRTAKKTAKPFANLMAALDAFDAGDLCGDLLMLDDAEHADAERISNAADALRTAESVETMGDFVANLQEAAEILSVVQDAASVVATINSILARCFAPC